jgi:hypothetical protein
MRSEYGLWVLAAAMCGVGWCSLPAFSATPEQVEAAIEKGKAFLYSKLNEEGNWEEVQKPEAATVKADKKVDNRQTDLKGRQWGGLTSIATYALLAAGENSQESKLKAAITFLQTANIQSTYGLGLSAQVWNLVPPTAESKRVAAHDVRMLDNGMNHKGNSAGFYAYWTGTKMGTDQPRWGDTTGYGPEPKGWYDLSNSQYAVLGMWALEQSGAEVPNDYWKTVEDAWKKAQQADGGWGYRPSEGSKPSMTAAGIATLFITQDYTLPDTWSACHGGAPTPQIDKGLEWMDKQIDQVMSSGDLYTLYGMERIGVASGRKYFGKFDWYKSGADAIVKKQRKDGGWSGGHGGDIGSTAFALLFLSRGSAPVMMNKLQYDTPRAQAGVVNVWNERPRDAANLARWTGHQLEHDLNWQIVNMEVLPADLHDAPILYVSGSQQMAYSPAKVRKFKEYVEEGGMILGNADCGKAEFAKSFIQLAKDLFPQYEFRQLPANHPIYTHQQFKADSWKVRPNVMGLTNGVRELMVLIPEADPSKAWQLRADKSREELFQLGSDVFLYAIDKKNLLSKGATYVVTPDPKIVATKKVKIARVMAGPNADPEPGGWRRLAAVLHNQYKLDVELINVKPGQGEMLSARIAHLTGTTAFKLSDPARLEIKAFVQNGGTLIIDAAGGSSTFADSVEVEMKAIFGNAAQSLDEPLPKSAPIYNLPDEKITSAGFRVYAKDSLPRGAKFPMIHAITIGNKLRVLYSPLDISGGMVGQPVDGIYGYDPQTSTQLMAAMVRYAAGVTPKSTTQPATKPKK